VLNQVAVFMKMFNFLKAFLAIITVAVLMLAIMPAAAQDSLTNTAPSLTYGVPQILQLSQAKVTDDVIVAYIHNSGNSYSLNADQIIYLRQKGISDKVLTAMLMQPKIATAPTPTTPAPGESYPVQAPITYPQSAPAYDQPVSSQSVYTIPNNQIYYYSSYYPFYYPYYYYPYRPYYNYRHSYARYYPSRSFSGGFHGGYHGGVAYASRGGNYASVGMSFHGGAYQGGGMMMHR